MLNLNALGYFMNFCNRHVGEVWMSQQIFDQGIAEIMCSSEGRFSQCNTTSDVFIELGDKYIRLLELGDYVDRNR